MTPFAPGSISVRLYPHTELPASRIVDELLAQGAVAHDHGFDGVMTSEHHGGFAGYLPNPIQAAAVCGVSKRRSTARTSSCTFGRSRSSGRWRV